MGESIFLISNLVFDSVLRSFSLSMANVLSVGATATHVRVCLIIVLVVGKARFCSRENVKRIVLRAFIRMNPSMSAKPVKVVAILVLQKLLA